MVAAAIHNSSVAHLQTRDEVQTAIGIPNDEIWRGFLNNTDTLANDLDRFGLISVIYSKLRQKPLADFKV